MALTDPQNVQLGQQRRAQLLARLAMQMRGKAAAAGRGAVSAAGRAQGTGRSFGNAVDLRAGATPKFTLPFALPDGRVRPAGFEDNPGQGPPSWATPAGGGGMGLGGTDGSNLGGTDGVVSPPDLSNVGMPQMDPSVPGGFPINPGGFNSDTPLSAPALPGASAAPAPSQALDPAIAARLQSQQAPDPYTVMMTRLNMLRQQRLDAATGGNW